MICGNKLNQTPIGEFNMAAVSAAYGFPYEHVAFSQTDQVLGTTGAAGDYLHRLIVSVGTSATGTVILTDGAFVHGLVRANTPIGTYSIEFNAKSQSTGWKITTGAGAEVLAMGVFT
jgi:hypothetical protein